MRLVEQLSVRMLAPEGHAAVSRFEDIVIQDGSSFALKNGLQKAFSSAVERCRAPSSAVERSTATRGRSGSTEPGAS